MSDTSASSTKNIPISVVSGTPVVEKQLGNDKIALYRAGFDTNTPTLRKPSWIRVRLPQGNAVQQLKARLRENALVRGSVVPEHPRMLQQGHRYLHDSR